MAKDWIPKIIKRILTSTIGLSAKPTPRKALSINNIIAIISPIAKVIRPVLPKNLIGFFVNLTKKKIEISSRNLAI